jgi:hypothetical protein
MSNICLQHKQRPQEGVEVFIDAVVHDFRRAKDTRQDRAQLARAEWMISPGNPDERVFGSSSCSRRNTYIIFRSIEEIRLTNTN